MTEPDPASRVSRQQTTTCMNKPLLLSAILLLSLNLAACGKQEEPKTTMEKAGSAVKEAAAKTGDALEAAADKTKTAVVATWDATGEKLKEWKLTPADLKEDLAKGSRIVRSKSAHIAEKTGEIFDNARVVTVINGKLVADRDLSALQINVDADSGVVTLKGTVKSAELLGRAIGLALDTDGVRQVVSLLTVES
jgi:hyperosmotically inducible protein